MTDTPVTRPMSAAELETVMGWAAEEGWNPGLADAAAFHAADPEGFFLTLVGGEPVAAISVVELTYTAQRYIGSTYKPFEMFLLSGILYMVIIYVVGQGIAWLDRKARIA